MKDFATTGKNDSGQDVGTFDAPDLTLQDQTEHVAGIIGNALEATRMIEIRETQANSVNQVHFLCRVKEQHARDVAHKIVRTLLYRTEAAKIEAFIGKQFLLKDGKFLYAWVFSFASDDLKKMAQVVCDALEESIPRRKVEVLEAPLMGGGTPQSSGIGVKGAMPLKG